MGIVVPLEEIDGLGDRLRQAGLQVVFTNGHFDLLHVGHLRYLQLARQQGDVLVVGVNDDAATTARKGPYRPIVPEEERVELVAGLACVDYATIFHGLTAEDIVARLRPDIYVKGGDYAAGAAPLPEREIVERYGGKTVIQPFVEGRSTSELIRLIRSGGN